MITIIVSVGAGMLTTVDTGWAVFWSLIIFQFFVGETE